MTLLLLAFAERARTDWGSIKLQRRLTFFLVYLVYTPGVCNHGYSKSLNGLLAYSYIMSSLLTSNFVVVLDKHFKWLFDDNTLICIMYTNDRRAN